MRRLRRSGQVEGVAEYIRRRVEGYEGEIELHYKHGTCLTVWYDLEAGEVLGVESFHPLALEIDREMKGHTGHVTVKVSGGRFGKPRYRTREPFDAIPREG